MISFVQIILMNILKFLFSRYFLKQLILAVVAVVVFSFVLLKWLKYYTNHNAFVEVPNLVGQSLNEAQTALETYTLRLQIQDSSNYNPKYTAGAVIEQEPLAGSKVKTDRKIYVILNPSDYQKVKIPNVIRKTLRQAKPTLNVLGFKVGRLIYVDDLGKDEVVALRHKGQIVNPGDALRKTSIIDLVVGNGKRRIIE
jgi:beta-lactam-binding protein with PASTA domain